MLLTENRFQMRPLPVLQGVQNELRVGFVDLYFECSTVCQTLLGLMGIWQKRLNSWARWWNTEIKVNRTQVYEHMDRPVHTHPCRGLMGLPVGRLTAVTVFSRRELQNLQCARS